MMTYPEWKYSQPAMDLIAGWRRIFVLLPREGEHES